MVQLIHVRFVWEIIFDQFPFYLDLQHSIWASQEDDENTFFSSHKYPISTIQLVENDKLHGL